MDPSHTQLSEHDRREKAASLNLTIEEFDRLLVSANTAHKVIYDMGSFYGQEDIKEPTFRITAEPVVLTSEARIKFETLGNDLMHLGRVLPELPENYKEMLGSGFDYRVPISWRIDAILDTQNEIRLNEVEGIDSVSALMSAEQMAYGLQTLEQTTLAQIVKTLRIIFPQENHEYLKIAMIRNLQNNPFTPNARRFIELMNKISGGTIHGELFDIGELQEGRISPEWQSFNAVFNEAYCSPQDLDKLGIKPEQLFSAGNYHPLVNKGLFAVFLEDKLEDFWKEKLGDERFIRLKNIMIPTKFITSVEEIGTARAEGKVAKVSWAEGNQIIINRAKGIAMTRGEIEENTDARWGLLEEYFKMGYKVIAQDFIEPAKIRAFLRKKGTNLEPVEWYNRICVKYVIDGDPRDENIPDVKMTAVEVTLGPDVIPAGRKCAFTAGMFEKS